MVLWNYYFYCYPLPHDSLFESIHLGQRKMPELIRLRRLGFVAEPSWLQSVRAEGYRHSLDPLQVLLFSSLCFANFLISHSFKRLDYFRNSRLVLVNVLGGTNHSNKPNHVFFEADRQEHPQVHHRDGTQREVLKVRKGH